MYLINFIIFLIISFISFFIGALWISNKELKFAKAAKFNCDNCQSLNCLYKFCSKIKSKGV